MSRRDAEGMALEEWLQQLGYPNKLQSQEVQHLLSPNMRSVWRYLQKHVKPVQSVHTIRKNLLLAKLQNENIQSDRIGNFKIQSREELMLVERVSNIQREVDSKNKERKTVDTEIKSLMCNIAEKRFNIIKKENEIKEIENKTMLLNLKLTQIQKDIEKLAADTSKASALRTIYRSDSYVEDSTNLTNISTILLKSKITPLSKEDQILLLNISKDYPMKTIYHAYLLASDSVIKSLKRFYVNMECPVQFKNENFNSSETSSFRYHLKYLNALVIQNQLDIVKYVENVKLSSAVLEKKKTELIDVIKDMFTGSCTAIRGDIDEVAITDVEEFVNKLLNNSLAVGKADRLKEFTEEINAECLEYDKLKQLVADTKHREVELHEEVEMKVTLINDLYYKLHNYNSTLDQEQTNVVRSCNESVFKFLSDIIKHEDVILASEHMISKEIQMFHDAPLSALTRRWENSNELLSEELIEELSTCPELRIFLLQSEPKNVLKSILEKKWWLCTLIEKYGN